MVACEDGRLGNPRVRLPLEARGVNLTEAVGRLRQQRVCVVEPPLARGRAAEIETSRPPTESLARYLGRAAGLGKSSQPRRGAPGRI